MSSKNKEKKLDFLAKWFIIILLIIMYHVVIFILFYPKDDYCQVCENRSYRKSGYQYVNQRQYPKRRKPSKTISTEMKNVKICVEAPKFERLKKDRRTAPEQREFL